MIKFFTRLFSENKGFSAGKILRRGFQAARFNRFNRLFGSIETADSILKKELCVLRARSRDLSMNNPYIRKFLRMLEVNIVGSKGITLQSKIKTAQGLLKDKTNTSIEEAWSEWSKKRNCTVNGKMSWVRLQQMVVRSVASEGEILIRKIRGKEAGNDYGFALQVLEADHLDDKYDLDLGGGNYIRMGIEFNKWGKPLAYHLLTQHPGDMNRFSLPDYRHRIRVDADDIVHVFLSERISQSRGIPWTVGIMFQMQQLGAYHDAAIINARNGASKMGFLTNTKEDADPTGGDDAANDEDEKGTPISDISPGVIEKLPYGWDFKPFDPQYPNGEFPLFTKSILRGIASGLGISYNSFANDLEGVNFSSIRSGTLEERDMYRLLQQWLIEELCAPIFEDWLETSLMSGAIADSLSDFKKLNKPVWTGRGWEWVDPLKDVKANSEAIANGFKSRQQVVAEQGKDFEDICSEQKEEEELIKKYKLTKIGQKNDTQDDKKSDIVQKKDDKDTEDKDTEDDENN